MDITKNFVRRGAEYFAIPVKLLMNSSIYIAGKMEQTGIKITIPPWFKQYASIPLNWWVTAVKKLAKID